LRLWTNKLKQESEFSKYIVLLSYLRRIIGDEELHEETVTYLVQLDMVDLILSFLNEQNIGNLNKNQIEEILYECILIVNGLVATKHLDLLSEILDPKHGIIDFLHKILQTYENWGLMLNAIMALGNIAWETTYRDLLFQTNFGARIKKIFNTDSSSTLLIKEWLISMKNSACK